MNSPAYNAVMVDLETMSTENHAAIVSMGAVRFWLNVKQEQFTPDQEFYINVDLESSVNAGLHLSAHTVKWWLKQGDSARRALDNGIDLKTALIMLRGFIPNDVYLFGNGATFDNVILRNAFRAVGMEYPVTYRNDMCYRTLKHLVDVPERPFEGTLHNALDDAKAQAWHLMDILERHPWVKF